MQDSSICCWADYKSDYKNRVILFQIKINNVENPILNIAALNVYNIYAYDKFLGFGPARAAHGYTREESYNLSEYVKDEEIVITVEVCANYVDNYFTANELPFFCAEVSDNGEVLATTTDFAAYSDISRIVRTQRYSFQRHFSESYTNLEKKQNFLLGDTNGYKSIEMQQVTGNQIISKLVNTPKYQVLQAYDTIDTGEIYEDDTLKLPTDRAIFGVGELIKGYKYEELEDKLSDEVGRLNFKTKECGNILKNQYKTFDFKRNVSGFIGLDIDVSEDCTVYAIWDEILGDKPYQKPEFFRMATCNVVKWKLVSGTYSLKSFEPYTMRYLKIIVMGGSAEIKNAYVTLFENPDADRLKFSCSDKDIQLIYEAAKNSFSQNAVDILMDCPSRERAGWLCDSYFTAQAERLLTGENLVENSFLQNYLLAPQEKFLPDGMIPMCYPSDNPDSVFIPNWSMWYVLELRNVLLRDGKSEIIEASREKVLGIIEYFKNFENEFGLLENLEKWVFIEWSHSKYFVKGINFPSNMLYSAMLSAASDLYDLPELKEKSDKLKKTIIELPYNGEFFIDQAIRENGEVVITENITETCQYYAFYFGIATRESHPKLFKTLMEKFGAQRDIEKVYPNVYPSNAFIGYFMRLDYMCKLGMADKAISQCKDYFLHMATETLTLWENDKSSASCNHGFASYVVNILVQGLTGYVGFSNGTAYFYNNIINIDCRIEIPIDNEKIVVLVENGKRTIETTNKIKIGIL